MLETFLEVAGIVAAIALLAAWVVISAARVAELAERDAMTSDE